MQRPRKKGFQISISFRVCYFRVNQINICEELNSRHVREKLRPFYSTVERGKSSQMPSMDYFFETNVSRYCNLKATKLRS